MPPFGYVPYDIFFDGYSQSLDKTGWSLQSEFLDFTDANVLVTDLNGTELPVDACVLVPYHGSTFAMAFRPIGWETKPDGTYNVHIDGAISISSGNNTPFDYTVMATDCSSE